MKKRKRRAADQVNAYFEIKVDQYLDGLPADKRLKKVPHLLLRLLACKLVLPQMQEDADPLMNTRVMLAFLQGERIVNIAQELNMEEADVHQTIMGLCDNLIVELTARKKPAWLDKKSRQKSHIQRTFRVLKKLYLNAIGGLNPIPWDDDLPVRLDEAIEWLSI